MLDWSICLEEWQDIPRSLSQVIDKRHYSSYKSGTLVQA